MRIGNYWFHIIFNGFFCCCLFLLWQNAITTQRFEFTADWRIHRNYFSFAEFPWRKCRAHVNMEIEITFVFVTFGGIFFFSLSFFRFALLIFIKFDIELQFTLIEIFHFYFCLDLGFTSCAPSPCKNDGVCVSKPKGESYCK